MGRAAKKQKSSQQKLTRTPLLVNCMKEIGKSINVPGSFWVGTMTREERATGPQACMLLWHDQQHDQPVCSVNQPISSATFSRNARALMCQPASILVSITHHVLAWPRPATYVISMRAGRGGRSGPGICVCGYN